MSIFRLDEMMVETLRRLLVAAGLLAAVSMVLSGCGRKADLDPPSMPLADQNKLTAKKQAAPPDERFILDPLL